MEFRHPSLFTVVSLLVAAAALPAIAGATTLDLATRSTAAPGLLRLHGSAGNGAFGVPVAGGHDCDGDGHQDFAMASMLADPSGTIDAGAVYLAFGDSTITGTIDTAVRGPRLLEIHGSVPQENAGSEIWIDDVTGDGIGDLLVGRQNFGVSIPRGGTGALSIVVGGPALRAHAATELPLVLDSPPEGVTVATIIGPQVLGRFAIWMRTGDVDGDGIADIAVGADQEQQAGARHAGAVYVLRGGPHLAASDTIDLASSATSPLDGHLLKITPPPGSAEYHFGATCQIADLDGNGRAEVLAAAALNRAGATLTARGGTPGSAHGIGGSPRGTVYILWDDNFPAEPWGATASFRFDESPGARSEIRGAAGNQYFGEELIGGIDVDGDGRGDLFVGDIAGDLSPARNRFSSGAGNLLYDAAALRGRTLEMGDLPEDVAVTTILGAAVGDIAADTAAAGDFDGDARVDLAFSAPHHAPLGRASAGALYVFFAQVGRWPALIDLADPLPGAGLRATTVYGALGSTFGDTGDTLAYSAASGDVDGDGRADLIINEMEGNGLGPETIDDGNLIAVDGALLAGQEPGSVCPPVPRQGCRQTMARRSVLSYRSSDRPERTRLDWRWARGAATTVDELGDPLAGATGFTLCVYDGGAAPQPAAVIELPAEADCPGGGCWRRAGQRGWRFRQRDGLPDGVQRATLRSGTDGRAAIAVRARGERVVLPAPLTLPVTIQLRRDDAPDVCWEAPYLEALRSDADRFIARGP